MVFTNHIESGEGHRKILNLTPSVQEQCLQDCHAVYDFLL